MNESRLDKDLKALAKRPRPDLPADFNEKVWSKVQSREKRSPLKRESWLRALFSLFQSPQWAVAAFALAIFVGWMAARITTVPGTNPTETKVAASVTGEVLDMACYFDKWREGSRPRRLRQNVYRERASGRAEDAGRNNLRTDR
jgi:hypothetical protein